MNVLIANYGNASIAMIQWAIETNLTDFMVFSVDTGWQSSVWNTHLEKVWRYLQDNNVVYQHLKSPKTFSECALDRGSFPSKKFQWCPSFLKGLAIIDALDEIDMNGEAIIHLAKIRLSSRMNQTLISGEENEHYDNRLVNYPLLDFSIIDRELLIERAGFDVHSRTSEECMPCIHSTQNDLKRMSDMDLTKLHDLESKVRQPMFKTVLDTNDNSLDRYDMGCGNIWGCGE